MTDPEFTQATVKTRHFTFTSGSDGASVECMRCGWTRRPRWRDHQRVFDLSNDHECAGVETFEHMTRRVAAEKARESLGRQHYAKQWPGGIPWAKLSDGDRELLIVAAERLAGLARGA